MTPEPLKLKRLGIKTYTESFAGSDIPSYETSKETDGGYFQYEDIKSAVKGCLGELKTEFDTFPPSTRHRIEKIFKKWFHDVM